MAPETMDIDIDTKENTRVDSTITDKKRKHKQKDPSSPSKKKRKHEASSVAAANNDINNEEEKIPSLDKKKKKDKKTPSSPSKEDQKLEKKRKSKQEKPEEEKTAPSKKAEKPTATTTTTTTTPDQNCPFKLTTATLYVPLSPISISPTHALASLQAEHLSPLLLIYYPPLKGIVLAYSNAFISENPPTKTSLHIRHDNEQQVQNIENNNTTNPQPLTLATTANEYGVLYVYLTATFLVFRPERGQTLEGSINVQSEGFLGAVVHNLFSIGIERKRLPSDWKWIPPGEHGSGSGGNGNRKAKKANSDQNEDDQDDENDSSSASSSSVGFDSFDPEKEHFYPPAASFPDEDDDLLNATSQTQAKDANTKDDDEFGIAAATSTTDDENTSSTGYFESISGHRVRGAVRFRVVDIDVIPGTERDRSFISIEGTMLSPDEEAQVIRDERNGVPSSSSSSFSATATSRKVAKTTADQDRDQDQQQEQGGKENVGRGEKRQKKEKKKKNSSKT